MKVSVVIPAINEAGVISRSIESARQAGADQVVVADGGSSDETVALAERLNCDVVHSPSGRARQQNAGAARASGDAILFQHADNWIGTESIAQIRRCLNDKQRWGGAFCQTIDSSGFAFRLLEAGNALRVRWRGLPYGDQGIFVRRDIFLESGGFPDVPLMEDLILMTRLRRRSWPVLLPGPIHINPRRWKQSGILRQTCRNWLLVAAYRAGFSPESLAGYYRRHDHAVTRD